VTFSIKNLFRLGRAEKDGSRGRRALSQKLLDRGIAAETAGKSAKALEFFVKSVEADESFAVAYMNLGIALQAAGDPHAAKTSYERALAIDPDYAAAHFNLARTQFLLGQHAAAEAGFRAALRLRNEFPEAWVGLAGALEAFGRDDEASDALGRAIAIRPDYPGALINSITLLHKLGRFDAAAANSRRLLELEPENALAHASLGVHAHRQGRLAEAEVSFRLALGSNPNYVAAKSGLAVVLVAMGRGREDLPLLLDAVASDPANAQLRRLLALTLDGFALRISGARERDILLSFCKDDTLSSLNLNPSVIAYTKSNAGFALLQERARQGVPALPSTAPEVAALWREPILLAALPRMPIMDADVEVVLTHVRQDLLRQCEPTIGSTDAVPDVPIEFVCALARQCHFSGYAFFAGADEVQRVARLRTALEDALVDASVELASIEYLLAVFALYESLLCLQGAERLQAQAPDVWSDAFRPVVIEQVANPLQERAIARELVSITSIVDDVSLAVRTQYEENPYPRWTTVQFPEPETIESLAARLRPGEVPRVRPRPVSVLIAGCGTGHLSIQYARHLPDANILAVDLSRTSLAYAARMTERFGISNIEYRQADILELGRLARRFALIDCSGVLHHLNDPMAGWRVLVDLLEPDGLMKICLYSERARRAIQSAREFARALELPPTPEGLRACRRAIAALPDGHPAKGVLAYGDFYALDGCRDMIMHVQEHQFTLPRLEACLNQLDLRFLGMDCKPAVHRQFREMFPDADSATNLTAWDRYEEAFPDTFISMYPLLCCRK
jgi:tetratricopeptide (TPR) repeat protein